MGVPEIKRETNVCAVKEWGVNEETITSKPGYEEASTVKHPLKWNRTTRYKTALWKWWPKHVNACRRESR